MDPRLFYDAGCALCHRAVRFAVRRDRGRPPVRFSPLGGDCYERTMKAEGHPELPDSLVVLSGGGELLVRSEAALYLARRAGGVWRATAALAALVPRRARDAVYDFVARRRRRWFGRTAETCPTLPPALEDRFDP